MAHLYTLDEITGPQCKELRWHGHISSLCEMKYPVSEISEDHTDPIVTEERLNTFKTFYREGNWLHGGRYMIQKTKRRRRRKNRMCLCTKICRPNL